MTAEPGLLGALAEIVGARHVLTHPDDLAACRADGRGAEGGLPMAALRPASAQQVCAIMRLAMARALRVVVQGARTGLVGGGLPTDTEADLVVSLDRLSRHIEIDPANRTATVDAGVRLSALNAVAAEYGLFLPIDLGADPMIGGMIATNTGGSRLLRYCDMRANLLALDMVRASEDGELLTLGAPLRKNNTGIDLKHLLVGSGGSMGIVMRATVSLQPLPATRLSALIALREADAALPLLQACEAAFGSALSAFEGMSAAALAAAFAHVPSLRRPFETLPCYALLIELSGGSAFTEAMLEEGLAAVLAPFMEGENAVVADAAIDRRDDLWAIRHALPEGLRASGAVVACDIALKRGDLMRFRSMARAALAREAPGFVPHDFGHIGDGGLHYNLVWPKRDGPVDPERADRARALIFDMVVRDFGGSFSAEHGIGPRNMSFYARFVPEPLRRLAGAVQHVVAPRRMGRVDFGMTGNG
ncbi:hypothetical protein B2G71_00205 [Novosphingobium sp. PC22D]|uniref:FAD-binding oxidoreductase n=1 Tax=Novosphingobium sp. PC22D TaxID=1962403 RepID=UPI000BF00356|nr:FAD-binding oxidoreductase [Novosphingobium sp. PC22D]PEQ14088.1 hypothetical protein B2G71_00205 [Novosphingobium sp. PC22D]